MYHVLLVDDEENVLEILRRTIQWQELGVAKLYVSQSAQRALNLMERYQIDLLITDIKMPDMDGIELIRRAKIRCPDIRCILLSAYQEFEYARSAIDLGVENYLCKPVIKDEVEQTVQKALDNLYRQRQIGENLLRENILRRWVSGSISGEELGERAVPLGLNLYLKAYCTVCFIKISKDDVGSFYIYCVEELKRRLEIYPFWDEKGRYVLIAGGSQLGKEALESLLSNLAEQQEIENKIRISVGTVVKNADHLLLSYQSACDDVELSDLNQSGVILHNEYVGRWQETDQLIEEVRFLLYNRDEWMQENGFRHLCHKLYIRKGEQETDRIAVRLLGICMKVFSTEFPLCPDLRDKIFSPQWKAERGQTEEAFTATVMEYFKEISHVFSKCYGTLSPIVQLAAEYVRTSAIEGTGGSIKEFCAKNGMSPAYLGHIFKKETGVFFNEYLNQCRINRSVILLRNPNNKIKDIAENVGFTSVSYFVKCFREKKGISPAKYRMGEKE